MPRLGKTPSRVLVSQLALALPRHVLGCLLSGQPAVPPDESTAELTACEILSSSCFDHVGKALTLLTSLCELAFHHRALREATLGQPAFAAQLTDAANMVLLAVAGPEAGACVGAAAEQERVQAALDRAAMVPAALRALAFAFTTAGRSGSGGDTAAAASAAADGVLDWQSICEALLQQPRGAMLLEAGFDAVRTLVLAVRAALVGDTQGEAVYRLAYYAGEWVGGDGVLANPCRGAGLAAQAVAWLLGPARSSSTASPKLPCLPPRFAPPRPQHSPASLRPLPPAACALRCRHRAAVIHVRHASLLPAPHAARPLGGRPPATRAGLPHAARHTHGCATLCPEHPDRQQQQRIQAGGGAAALLHRWAGAAGG